MQISNSYLAVGKRVSLICFGGLVACSGANFDGFQKDNLNDVTTGGATGSPTAGVGGASTGPSTTSGTGEGPGANAGASVGSASVTGAAATGTGGSAGAGGTSGGSGGAAGLGNPGPDAAVTVTDAGPLDSGPPDAGVFVSACAGKSRKMTTSDLFIGDFENGSLQDWYDFGANGAINRTFIEAPGAAGTSRAVHLSATGLTSFGAGVGIFTGCWDVSDLDGVSFWAKGIAGTDNIIQFQVALPATHQANYGGDCTAMCNDHPSKRLSLTNQWKQYTVTFAELTQAGFGAPAHYNGIMMALNWVSFSGPAVNFWVDEVALYRGSATSGPVSRGKAGQ